MGMELGYWVENLKFHAITMELNSNSHMEKQAQKLRVCINLSFLFLDVVSLKHPTTENNQIKRVHRVHKLIY